MIKVGKAFKYALEGSLMTTGTFASGRTSHHTKCHPDRLIKPTQSHQRVLSQFAKEDPRKPNSIRCHYIKERKQHPERDAPHPSSPRSAATITAPPPSTLP